MKILVNVLAFVGIVVAVAAALSFLFFAGSMVLLLIDIVIFSFGYEMGGVAYRVWLFDHCGYGLVIFVPCVLVLKGIHTYVEYQSQPKQLEFKFTF